MALEKRREVVRRHVKHDNKEIALNQFVTTAFVRQNFTTETLRDVPVKQVGPYTDFCVVEDSATGISGGCAF